MTQDPSVNIVTFAGLPKTGILRSLRWNGPPGGSPEVCMADLQLFVPRLLARTGYRGTEHGVEP
ncbi:uncharacterized protein N7473_004911 [Penicillium subrubescens]|uniref:uncharacterized protein n=1 Tax=Penicillium subrubescens TaxID=1316194 RepID=UPI0025451BBB|nr:uncharacterized protein N7473_004911 [Penicillium subrubescens]KAJ5900841.1 hypothetical protein N7473_004911 [Penicillium subrubescens]